MLREHGMARFFGTAHRCRLLAWRDQRDWTERKYAMWEAIERGWLWRHIWNVCEIHPGRRRSVRLTGTG